LGLVDRILPDREVLADALGVRLTPMERQSLRCMAPERLRELIADLGGGVSAVRPLGPEVGYASPTRYAVVDPKRIRNV
jgi:hypothetical protein